jgi:tetratricopeptide (TPR) repeat protein
LSGTNRSAVEQIVSLLDGLPLAIELAASRARVLSPSQIAERMRDRFALLAGASGAAQRQATLRAAIDWSWGLLVPWEQAALAQCSVFEGGFTLEAAEAVFDLAGWAEAPPVVDVVQALVDKSLLRTWAPADHGRHDLEEPHFGMYLSIHEYAAEKLRGGEPGVEAAAEDQHARYFAGFGTDEAMEALCRHGGVKRRHALALELDNLVAACRRAVARGRADQAAATYRAAWEVLELQGPFALGATLGAQVFGIDTMDSALRATVHVTRARASWRAGRTEEGQRWLEQALALARTAGDRRCEGSILGHLGDLRREQGRIDEARSHLEAAPAIQREVGNRHAEAGLLGNLGILQQQQGELDDALPRYLQTLAIYRKLGDRRGEGSILGNLGTLYSDQGRIEEAQAHYEANLAIAREVGSRRGEGIVLANLGTLHHERGRLEEAQMHYEQARALACEVGDRRAEGIVLSNLGRLDSDRGLLQDAREHYELALAIAREVGSHRDEGHVLANLGSLHRDQGRIEQALAHYDQALARHREVGDRDSEGSILGNLAELLIQQRRESEARQALGKAEALLQQVGNAFELAKIVCIKGRVEALAGATDLALAALAEAEAVAATISAGPDSELGRKIAQLREALT